VTLIRYEILGAVRAFRGDDEIDLGPTKQRAVLAYLLLNANRAVLTPAIVDAVWGDEPPANGPNVVQKHVAGLRRLLEPERSPRASSGVLVRSDGGYKVVVSPGSMDVDAVTSAIGKARQARADADLRRASSFLRDAIAMWRSQALAGLSGHVFEAARERYAEMRLATWEELAETELDLGRHADLVPELVELVARHPARERLRYLLILALYRSDRQADALAAFRDAHRHLSDEYGVAPGDALTELHQRILRADPALSLPALRSDGRAPAPMTAPGRGTDGNAFETPAPVAAPGPPGPPPQPLSISPGLTEADSPAGPPALPFVVQAMPHPITDREFAMAVLGAVVGGLVILGSLGFMTCVVITAYAAARRSVRLAIWAVAYLVVAVVTMALIVTTNPDGSGHELELVPLWLGLVAGGLAHVVYLAASRPRSYWRPARPVAAAPPPLDAAIIERHARRESARQILATHPDLAQQLRIGKPHLPRTFDDGGLIDVNSVPERLIVIMSGMSPLHAHQIVRDRLARGPYRAVDDLVGRGLIDPVSFSLHRSVLIAVPVATEKTAPAPYGRADMPNALEARSG
jgi:DNA-binding SARP family transcriptional activator